jgi:predicted Ser/Thr protein kinase
VTAAERKRVQEVVEAACKRDPEEREAFLDEACAGKPWLRDAVALQLRGDRQSVDAQTRPGTDRPAELEPRTIGPYIIRHEIGRGGMGIVYLADDTRLSRRVALKAVAPGLGRDPVHVERLWREARAAAALSHPGIATVYAVEEIEGDLYLACEFVPGRTLRTLFDENAVQPSDVVDIAAQLARALAAAHNQGIVHRDLKPENIVITPAGVVKILDFGIARMESLTPQRLTQTGTIVGTPGYMAPEQVAGEASDFRIDQFSFGVLVYEMASGSNPFVANTIIETLARIRELEPPPLSAVPGMARLDAIVATCLRKRPEDRYKTTQDLVADLDRLQARMSRAADRTASRRRPDMLEPAVAAPVLDRRKARNWWRTHQVALMALYVIGTARAWQIKEWLHTTLPLGAFFALGVGAMIGGTIRGHLIFTDVFNSARLAEERRRTRAVLVAVDLLIAATLIADALLLAPQKALAAIVTSSLALGIPLATLVMEPATTDAAFGDDRAPGVKRKTQGAKRKVPTDRQERRP